MCGAIAAHRRNQQARGTQDVNDPGAPFGPRRRAGGGVVHVLGSIPMLVGTAVRGGIKRRPICRAARARKFLQPANLLATGVSEDQRRSESIIYMQPG
jgi:hypothetical protein